MDDPAEAPVEVIPLAEGDLTWVFPDLDEAGAHAVRSSLNDADGYLRALAERLHLPPGTGGLAFQRIDGFPLAGVFGSVGGPDISFRAALYFPRRCLWDAGSGPPWTVEAAVTVPCDREDDCGDHPIAERTLSHDVPAEAARALHALTAWLLHQSR